MKDKVMRLLIYEGEPEDLEEVLYRSLPEGVRKSAGVSITVKTIHRMKIRRIEQEINKIEIQLFIPKYNIGCYPSGFIFWDEVGLDWYGPYPSIHAAKASVLDYEDRMLGR